jgi:hypothetical protein
MLANSKEGVSYASHYETEIDTTNFSDQAGT